MKKVFKIRLIVLLMIMVSFVSYAFKEYNVDYKLHKHKVENKCTFCNGSGSCSECMGEGKVICTKCDGKGKGEEIKLNNGYGSHNIITCPDCNGKGSAKCRPCNASGKCKKCNGTGKS